MHHAGRYTRLKYSPCWNMHGTVVHSCGHLFDLSLGFFLKEIDRNLYFLLDKLMLLHNNMCYH